VSNQLLRVRLEIAVGVAHQPDASGFADKDAVIEHFQGARQDQTICEDGPLVHDTVVIRILENHDVPDWIQVWLLRLQVSDEAGHLDDPQPAREIPIHDGWILNERLAGDDLDVITRRHEERLHRISGR
jgi:hypothetical protein